MDKIVEALAQYGMPGIVIAALGFVAWRQSRDLKELTDKRVEEARSVGKDLLELAEKWNETLSKLVEGVRSQKDGMSEVRRVMEKMNERMAGCSKNRSD